MISSIRSRMRRESPKPTVTKQGDSNQVGVESALHQMKLSAGGAEAAEDNVAKLHMLQQPGPQMQQQAEVELKATESRGSDSLGRFAGSLFWRLKRTKPSGDSSNRLDRKN
jgi:hypothetical protein